MLKRKLVSLMEKIKCKTCGNVGYSAAHDVRCTRCGKSNNEILQMDRTSEKRYDIATINYLQRLATSKDKPSISC